MCRAIHIGRPLAWLAVLLAVFSTASLAQLTIMPMGDSITAGVDYYTATAGGYRDPLYHDLVAARISFTFVGVNNNVNYYGSATPALVAAGQDSHNGFGGYEIIDLFNNLDGSAAAVATNTGNQGGYWLTGGGSTGRRPLTPGIILLQIGTNDIIQGVPLPTAKSRLSALVNKIHTLSPNTVVFVAAIPPIPGSLNASIATYNSYIQNTLVPSLSYTRFVDNYSTFFNSDGSVNTLLLGADNVHPTRYGYPVMAQNWANAIRAFAGVNPATYNLSVVNGTGSGSYPAGSIVTINSNTPASGNQFASWSAATTALSNPFSPITTYVMPAASSTVTANYRSSGSPVIPNGVYNVVGAPASFQFAWVNGLSMTATGMSASSTVQQQAYTGSSNQQWMVTNLGNNVVELSLPGTNNFLTVVGGSTASNAAINVEPYSGNASQQWKITPMVGTIDIVNVGSGLAINISGYSNTPGTALVQSAAGLAANQLWAFYPATQSAAATSNYTLTVNNGSGTGSYPAGASVTVSANSPASGYQFSGWTGSTSALANASAATTTLTMPAAATTITANYSAIVIPKTAITATGSGSSTSGTIYQDSFSRSGDLVGSSPDVTDTNKNAWASTTGSGQYLVNGNTVSISPSAYAYSAAFLPVNGNSGVTLDGTQDFTLSVVVTPGTPGLAGIALSTGLTANSYSNLTTNSFATLLTSSGLVGAYSFNGGYLNYNYAPGITGPTPISLSYSASQGTLTYTVGSNAVNTQSGVSADQIAALRAVALGNSGYGASNSGTSPTFDNFTLTIGASASGATGTGTGGGGASAPTYTLTVTNGTGSGSYTAGTSVTVTANSPASGYQFAGWTRNTSVLANASLSSTTLTMPKGNASITAAYSAVAASTSSGSYAIPDGTYELKSQSSGLAMAVTGTTNASVAVQQSYASAGTQQWTVTNLGNNVVKLTIAGTNQALEVPGSSTSGGQMLDVSAYTGASNQQWAVISAGNNYYEIVNAYSGLEVNVAGNSMNPGAGICQWFAGNYANGVWAFTPVSAQTTYALTVTNGSSSGNYAPGSTISISANAAAAGYQFAGWTGSTSALADPTSANTTVTMPAGAVSISATYGVLTTGNTGGGGTGAVPNGTYRVVAQSSGLALATAGSQVIQQTYTSAATQQWNVTNLGNNIVKLVNNGVNAALEVSGASHAAGASIDIASYTGGTHQQWTTVPVGGQYELVNVNSGMEANVAYNSMASGTAICQWFSGNYSNGLWSFQTP